MIDVVGIGSWDRSGSTILAAILGSANGVISVGEINNLWSRGVQANRPCGCGEAFRECQFWSQVMSTAFGSAADKRLLDRIVTTSTRLSNQRMIAHRLSRKPDPEAETYAHGLDKLYQAISAVSGASVIVDSAKIPWHLDLIDRPETVSAWYLHLIRDPRGVVTSHKKVLAYDVDDADPLEMNRHGAIFTTAGWAFRNALISTTWGNHRRYMRIRYEDFVADANAAAGKILARVGVTEPNLPFESANEFVMPAEHIVSGNPSRFETGRVTIESDEAWRNRMGRLENAAIGGVTLPMRYAYRRPVSISPASNPESH